MAIKLYQSKHIPWKWCLLHLARYERPFFFNVTRTPSNWWLGRFRFFANINLFFVSYFRNNSGFSVGIGLSKRHIVVRWHDYHSKARIGGGEKVTQCETIST